MKYAILLVMLTATMGLGCKGASAPPAAASEKPVTPKVSPVSSAPRTANAELPICEIEHVESCEVESEHPAETIYRCDRCRDDGVPCADCQKKAHQCETCGHTPCLCRHAKE